MSLSLAKLFGYNLRKLRNEKGISQQALSNELQISKAALSYYENGQRVPDIDTLKKVAVYFNVSADYLLGLSDVSSNDKDLKEVCAYTGLSEKIIKTLADSKNKTTTNEPVIIPLPLNYCNEIKIQDTTTLQDIFNIFFADGSDNGDIDERNNWLDLFRLITYYCYHSNQHNSLILRNIISDYFNTLFPEYRGIEEPISIDLTIDPDAYPF